MDENETQEQEEPRVHTSPFLEESVYENKRKYLVIVAIVVFALLVLGSAVFFFTRGSGEVVSPSPTPLIVEESPSPAPQAEVKREDLKLQVLNGLGVPGTAGKARDYLEGLGYKDIDAGNADSFDYRKTEIRIKDGKKAYLKILEEDLGEEYTLASLTKTLAEDSEFDAVVIIGGPAPTPSPSPTASPSASPSPESTPNGTL